MENCGNFQNGSYGHIQLQKGVHQDHTDVAYPKRHALRSSRRPSRKEEGDGERVDYWHIIGGDPSGDGTFWSDEELVSTYCTSNLAFAGRAFSV